MEQAPAIVQPGGRSVTHRGRDALVPVHPRTVVEPMTSTETRIHITVSPEFVALLKKAKAGQGHVQPGATDEQVLTAALRLFIEKQEKRKALVPAKVKREVRKRDQGRCQWPLASGGVCGSEVRLEVDHVVPRGKGGPSTVENCRVLCRVHNVEAARDVYGDEVMDRYTKGVPGVGEPCAVYGVDGAVRPTPPRGTRRPIGRSTPAARPSPRTPACAAPCPDRRPTPARAPARPASG